jgi:hypothetical protein
MHKMLRLPSIAHIFLFGLTSACGYVTLSVAAAVAYGRLNMALTVVAIGGGIAMGVAALYKRPI